MELTLKSWIYKDIQSKAFCNSKTIVWNKNIERKGGKEVETFTIKVKEIVRETEKAVLVNCIYWYHGGRAVSFKEYDGYKVWIPKSSILN
jgi:hypothetical protein